jgi:IclR family pca regulon transcriptional regulator
MPTTNAQSAATPADREITIAEQIDAMTDPSFMTSLARGLAVLQAFADTRQRLTAAQISQKTGIPRAAVSRCLYTLKQLGYADSDVNHYSLRPKVLTLGHSYLSSTPLTLAAQPYLDDISRTLNASCSLAVLDGYEIVYVTRSATSRVMSMALPPGSRLPAYCTSLGRAILAHMPEVQLQAYFDKAHLTPLTAHTIISQKQLRALLHHVRELGYAVSNEEFEIGLRSIAVPLHGGSGVPHAALSVNAQATHVAADELAGRYLPLLQQGARDLAVLFLDCV